MALVSGLQPGTDLGDSGLEQLENGGLLTARMPAILVEPFLSHPLEAEQLAAPDGQRRDAIAHAITNGIDAWLRMHGLGPLPDSTRAQRMTREDPLLGPARGSPAAVLAAALPASAARPDQLWAYAMEVYRLAPQVGLDRRSSSPNPPSKPGGGNRRPGSTTSTPPASALPGATSPDRRGLPAPRRLGRNSSTSTFMQSARSREITCWHPISHSIRATSLHSPRVVPSSPTRSLISPAPRATDPNYGDSIARLGNRLFGPG